MRGNKKGIRKAIGQLYRIPLGDGTFGYCQMVDKTRHAFFDYRDHKESDIEKILNTSMLFKCTVDSYIINKGYWEIIGMSPIADRLKQYEPAFSYNPFIKSYQIFKDGIGDVPATWEEIKDLEIFASWTHTGIEQRLRDHFEGRPNYFIESDKSRHLPHFPKAEEFYKQYGCVLVDKENWVYAPPGTKVKYD